MEHTVKKAFPGLKRSIDANNRQFSFRDGIYHLAIFTGDIRVQPFHVDARPALER